MLVTLLILVPAGLLLAVLAVAARLASRRNSRVAAGGPAVPPQAHRTERGAAVPVVTDLPEREERTAFAYDNGLKVGAAEESQ
jgi:hypothetical protein